MTQLTLALGTLLLAVSPLLALFATVVAPKPQLLIVATTAAFFYLVSATLAAAAYTTFRTIGLDSGLAAILPMVLCTFCGRCSFVALYHRVEKVVQSTLLENTSSSSTQSTTAHTDSNRTLVPPRNSNNNNSLLEIAPHLRLALNDASAGLAAGVGFGGMHLVLLFGTLWASQSTAAGVLYQESCPNVPSLIVSAWMAACFSILDVFWMLLAFFGMRRRQLFPRHDPHNDNASTSIGGWLGNGRLGGNVALLWTLGSHLMVSCMTLANTASYGCAFSSVSTGTAVLFTSFLFWAGVGRIYLPPSAMPRREIRRM